MSHPLPMPPCPTTVVLRPHNAGPGSPSTVARPPPRVLPKPQSANSGPTTTSSSSASPITIKRPTSPQPSPGVGANTHTASGSATASTVKPSSQPLKTSGKVDDTSDAAKLKKIQEKVKKEEEERAKHEEEERLKREEKAKREEEEKVKRDEKARREEEEERVKREEKARREEERLRKEEDRAKREEEKAKREEEERARKEEERAKREEEKARKLDEKAKKRTGESGKSFFLKKLGTIRHGITLATSSPTPVKKERSEMWKAGVPKPTNLLSVLPEPELAVRFRQFLENEYCEESFNFWNEVESFNAMVESGIAPGEVQNEAKRIFEKYIRPGSQYEVNFPAGIASELEPTITHPKPDLVWSKIFSRAQTEAYHIMQDHSFPRWLGTIEWLPGTPLERATSPSPEPSHLNQSTATSSVTKRSVVTSSPLEKRKPLPPSLASTLSNQGLRDVFKNYLVAQGNQEPLLLWQEIESLSTHSFSSKLQFRQEAIRIFRTFCDPSSRHNTGVQSCNVNSLQAILFGDDNDHLLNSSTFKAIQADAFSLMIAPYSAWCSKVTVWGGKPPPSTNDQVIRSQRIARTGNRSLPKPTKTPQNCMHFDSAPSFEVAMQHSILSEKFKQYLSSQGAQGLLDFLQSIDSFSKLNVDPKDLQELGQKLFATFITHRNVTAQMPLENFPWSVRDELYTRLGFESSCSLHRINSKMFDKAAMWALTQMKSVHYEAWIATNAWKVLQSPQRDTAPTASQPHQTPTNSPHPRNTPLQTQPQPQKNTPPGTSTQQRNVHPPPTNQPHPQAGNVRLSQTGASQPQTRNVQPQPGASSRDIHQTNTTPTNTQPRASNTTATPQSHVTSSTVSAQPSSNTTKPGQQAPISTKSTLPPKPSQVPPQVQPADKQANPSKPQQMQHQPSTKPPGTDRPAPQVQPSGLHPLGTQPSPFPPVATKPGLVQGKPLSDQATKSKPTATTPAQHGEVGHPATKPGQETAGQSKSVVSQQPQMQSKQPQSQPQPQAQAQPQPLPRPQPHPQPRPQPQPQARPQPQPQPRPQSQPQPHPQQQRPQPLPPTHPQIKPQVQIPHTQPQPLPPPQRPLPQQQGIKPSTQGGIPNQTRPQPFPQPKPQPSQQTVPRTSNSTSPESEQTISKPLQRGDASKSTSPVTVSHGSEPQSNSPGIKSTTPALATDTKGSVVKQPEQSSKSDQLVNKQTPSDPAAADPGRKLETSSAPTRSSSPSPSSSSSPSPQPNRGTSPSQVALKSTVHTTISSQTKASETSPTVKQGPANETKTSPVVASKNSTTETHTPTEPPKKLTQDSPADGGKRENTEKPVVPAKSEAINKVLPETAAKSSGLEKATENSPSAPEGHDKPNTTPSDTASAALAAAEKPEIQTKPNEILQEVATESNVKVENGEKPSSNQTSKLSETAGTQTASQELCSPSVCSTAVDTPQSQSKASEDDYGTTEVAIDAPLQQVDETEYVWDDPGAEGYNEVAASDEYYTNYGTEAMQYDSSQVPTTPPVPEVSPNTAPQDNTPTDQTTEETATTDQSYLPTYGSDETYTPDQAYYSNDQAYSTDQDYEYNGNQEEANNTATAATTPQSDMPNEGDQQSSSEQITTQYDDDQGYDIQPYTVDDPACSDDAYNITTEYTPNPSTSPPPTTTTTTAPQSQIPAATTTTTPSPTVATSPSPEQQQGYAADDAYSTSPTTHSSPDSYSTDYSSPAVEDNSNNTLEYCLLDASWVTAFRTYVEACDPDAAKHVDFYVKASQITPYRDALPAVVCQKVEALLNELWPVGLEAVNYAFDLQQFVRTGSPDTNEIITAVQTSMSWAVYTLDSSGYYQSYTGSG
ncbi:regulator of G-protein signaling [Pelomyxa schiedti]|nr:regulator of G-protein signaling [Pelomyxa schiedti]